MQINEYDADKYRLGLNRSGRFFLLWGTIRLSKTLDTNNVIKYRNLWLNGRPKNLETPYLSHCASMRREFDSHTLPPVKALML